RPARAATRGPGPGARPAPQCRGPAPCVASRSRPLAAQLYLQSIQGPPQPRVDRPPGQLERLGDLPRRVLEQVAQDDDRPMLSRERGERGDDAPRIGAAAPGLLRSVTRAGAPTRLPLDRGF